MSAFAKENFNAPHFGATSFWIRSCNRAFLQALHLSEMRFVATPQPGKPVAAGVSTPIAPPRSRSGRTKQCDGLPDTRASVAIQLVRQAVERLESLTVLEPNVR